jgi:hypothetical protein
MAEPLLAHLKSLEARIAALRKTRPQGSDEATTWNRLREELERIVPGSSSDTDGPQFVSESAKQVERKWIADDAALWHELRVELEAARVKIKAELEARRSRKLPPSQTRQAPLPRPKAE